MKCLAYPRILQMNFDETFRLSQDIVTGFLRIFLRILGH